MPAAGRGRCERAAEGEWEGGFPFVQSAPRVAPRKQSPSSLLEMPGATPLVSFLLVPEVLVRLVEPWAARYGDSAVLATLVTFLHLAGILVGGGLAITTDRAILHGLRAGTGALGNDARGHLLADLARSHRTVITALAVVFVTGALLAAADLETYLASPVYWVKMALVALLLGNGALLGRAERSLHAAGGWDESTAAAMRRSAHVSRALWLATLLAGVALVNVA